MFGAPPVEGRELAFHLRVGVPANEIHQVAVDTDAEMILVGKDEPQGLWRLFHRTTVDSLLRIAHVPVVVARQKDFRGLERSASPDPAADAPDVIRLGCRERGAIFMSSRRATGVGARLRSGTFFQAEPGDGCDHASDITHDR